MTHKAMKRRPLRACCAVILVGSVTMFAITTAQATRCKEPEAKRTVNSNMGNDYMYLGLHGGDSGVMVAHQLSYELTHDITYETMLDFLNKDNQNPANSQDWQHQTQGQP